MNNIDNFSNVTLDQIEEMEKRKAKTREFKDMAINIGITNADGKSRKWLIAAIRRMVTNRDILSIVGESFTKKQ